MAEGSRSAVPARCWPRARGQAADRALGDFRKRPRRQWCRAGACGPGEGQGQGRFRGRGPGLCHGPGTRSPPTQPICWWDLTFLSRAGQVWAEQPWDPLLLGSAHDRRPHGAGSLQDSTRPPPDILVAPDPRLQSSPGPGHHTGLSCAHCLSLPTWGRGHGETCVPRWCRPRTEHPLRVDVGTTAGLKPTARPLGAEFSPLSADTSFSPRSG